MNLETGISLAAVLFGVISFGFGWISYKKQRDFRGLLEFVGQKAEDLEDTLAKNKETLEATSQHIAELSRRVVWLETRIRHPKQVSEEVLDEKMPGENSTKPTITERRRRVITLASRGQDTETIAATLGMLPGEVELIINLSRAA